MTSKLTTKIPFNYRFGVTIIVQLCVIVLVQHNILAYSFTSTGNIQHQYNGITTLTFHNNNNNIVQCNNYKRITRYHLARNDNDNDISNNDTSNNDTNNNPVDGLVKGWNNFWTELDNFMDDASARRLGNGAAFYGKRKSNFYGENDRNKKQNSQMADPTEDYQAPNTGGYFQWMRDDDGEMRPVSRLRKQNIERNPKFWDRFYEQQNKNEE